MTEKHEILFLDTALFLHSQVTRTLKIHLYSLFERVNMSGVWNFLAMVTHDSLKFCMERE